MATRGERSESLRIPRAQRDSARPRRSGCRRPQQRSLMSPKLDSRKPELPEGKWSRLKIAKRHGTRIELDGRVEALLTME